MLRLLFCISLFSFAFIACEEDAFFEVPGGESKIVAFSEIDPSEKIRITVQTSIGVNTEDEFSFPKQGDINIRFFENGIEQENPGFRYITSQNAFLSQGDFRPKPNVEYGLEIQLRDENTKIKSIYGTTAIPAYKGEPEIQISRTTLKNELHANIALEDVKAQYFLIRTHAKNKDQDQSIKMEEIEIFDEEAAAIIDCFEGNILVSKADLKDYQLNLALNTSNLNSSGFHYDTFVFDVIILSEEAFRYHTALSKSRVAHTTVMNEPVISFTNFENGLGIFAGAHKKSFEIQF